ncbi:MAG: thymidylate kinase [Patescibacteria group bacterium]
MQKGVFIVIDGTDGSGKATQTKLLVEKMKQEGLRVETISFPQYGKKSAGCVEEYLAGTYGSAQEVGPYRTSVFYAVDRFDASKKIQTWLESGSHVVCDRYVGANMGHQGSKILDPAERKKFFAWAIAFEHDLMGIPKPDLNLILHIPSELTLELMHRREQTEGSKHGLEHDVHEADPGHLAAAEQAYLDIAEQFENFHLVECIEKDELMTPEAIHQKIWKKINSLTSLKEE